MEDHQVDMYYFFKNNTRRRGILLEYLAFMGQEWEQMSRFVQTRYLSPENCCNKEFNKFPSLKSMFQSRTDNSLGIDREKLQPRRVRIRINRCFFKNLKGWVHFFEYCHMNIYTEVRKDELYYFLIKLINNASLFDY